MKKVIAFLPLMSLSTAAEAYPMVNTVGETCESQGFATMVTEEECFAAAEKMGLQARFSTVNIPRPLGCYRKGTRVYFGLHPNTFSEAQTYRKPICKTDSPAFPWIFEDDETCALSGLSMLSEEECWAAGEAQGLVKGYTTSNPDRPEGCYRKGYKVFYGHGSENVGNGAQQANGRHPVCGPAISEPEPVVTEVPEFQYADNGICDSTHYVNTLPGSSNTDQCAVECKEQGFDFFASCEECGGQPACRCCDSINHESGAGGWSQFAFVHHETTPEAVIEQGGVCDGTVVYTDESDGMPSNKEQCLAECASQGKAYFASCENCGQPACRCCDGLKTSYAGGWLQYRIEMVSTLTAPIRRIDGAEHNDDSEEDAIALTDE